MNNINDKTITKLMDAFDEATMAYYNGTKNEQMQNTAVSNYKVEKQHTNYYEAFLKIADGFFGEEISIYDEEASNKISEVFTDLIEYLDKNGVNSEELRKALLMIDINGFKNVCFDLDLITPDVIGLVFVHILGFLSDKDNLTIYDPNIGTGNLIFVLANYLNQNSKFLGAENHELLTKVVAKKADLMEIPLQLYHEDALAVFPDKFDIAVSDLANYDYENEEYHSALYDDGVRYFPYLLIEHMLSFAQPVHGLFLIDNAFFSHKDNLKFKKMLEENGSIISLITLPLSLFQDEKSAKSIICITNESVERKASEIFVLPTFDKKEQFISTINNIQQVLKNNNF